MLSLAQLRIPVTEDEALDVVLAKLQAAGFNATSWGSTSLQRKFLRWGAFVYSDLTKLVAALADLGFNSTSRGDALTELSASHYDNTRMPAVATIGPMVLYNSGLVDHTITVGSVVVAYTQYGTATQRTFRNTTAPAGNLLSAGGTATLTFEAETAGYDWNISSPVAAPDTLELITALAGVIVSNPSLGATWYTTAGADEESDERLQLRNSTKWATLNAGQSTEDAVINYCLNASSAIERIAIDDPSTTGLYSFTAYIAGATGPVGSSDVAAAAAALAPHFFGTGTSNVVASAAQTIAPTGDVYFAPEFASADVITAVTDALTAFLATAPLGGFTYSGGLSHFIRLQELGTAIENAEINGTKCVRAVALTGSDIPVGSYEVPTLGSLSGLTFTAAIS
jgi:hypothetical protein